jgi:hypothetical protein
MSSTPSSPAPDTGAQESARPTGVQTKTTAPTKDSRATMRKRKAISAAAADPKQRRLTSFIGSKPTLGPSPSVSGQEDARIDSTQCSVMHVVDSIPQCLDSHDLHVNFSCPVPQAQPFSPDYSFANISHLNSNAPSEEPYPKQSSLAPTEPTLSESLPNSPMEYDKRFVFL